VIGGWITDSFVVALAVLINLVPGIFVAVAVPMLVKIDQPRTVAAAGADYLSMVFHRAVPRLPGIHARRRPALELVQRSRHSDYCVDQRFGRHRCSLANLACYANPVVDLRALKDRNFALGCFFSFVTGIGIFATIYLTPLFLGRVRGFSALQIGLAVFSTGVFQIMAIPVYAFSRQPRRPALAHDVRPGVLRAVDVGVHAHHPRLGRRRAAAAAGAARHRPAVRGAAHRDAHARRPGDGRLKLASGLFNLMRNLGGALGIAVCATLLNDRTNLHFYRLAEHLTRSNDATTALLDGLAGRLQGRKRSAGRRVRGAQAALAASRSRGPDAHVLRCFLWHHGLLHHRHRDGAA
jgi:DHA2 family multidrug resistance protein